MQCSYSIVVRAFRICPRQAVSDSLALWNFYVYDGFTEKPIDARVSIYEADSVAEWLDSIESRLRYAYYVQVLAACSGYALKRFIS